jgi:L-fucose isomerase-like protein
MKDIAIYTLTSELQNQEAVNQSTTAFLQTLNMPYELKGADYSDYGQHALDLIYVCTGGTEGLFRRLLPTLQAQSSRPFYLLTSGKSNSLAASMEILSFLRQHGLKGEIIHGDNHYILNRIDILSQVGRARKVLQGCKLGIIGKPSDWLISSEYDSEQVRSKLGVELQDIPMCELLDILQKVPDGLPGAEEIERGLRVLVERHQLQGLTIRCFDLLSAVHNTGCLALARLNSDGIVAGCEGDVPAMLSMMIVRALTGVSGFQANPARINPQTGEMLFAHCTIPLNMVERYDFDTHFESGIGIAIRGYMKEGPVTIFKVSGDLSRHFIEEGYLVRNQSEPDLCRTQQVIRFNNPSRMSYFLTEPIGNHHIILPGHHRELLQEFTLC